MPAFQFATSTSAANTELQIDQTLLAATMQSTAEGFEMTGVKPAPVGCSRFMSGDKEFSVLVSLYGQYVGSMYINMSRHAALFLGGELLCEPFTELSDDLFDCVCEIGNMVGGRFKENLRETRFGIDHISLPALIMGANYNLYHARGIITASVTFEIEEMPMYHMRDKFFHVSVSLMQR